MRDGRQVSEQVTKRVPGLDSLRALAVFVVVGYHLGIPWLAGGFLGVTLFFVLSGYLITRLLLAEIESAGSINLVQFWVRRLRRLAPAAYTVVLVCLVGAMIIAPDLLAKVRPDAVAAMGYVSNWWMIFHRVSYFDSFGLPSPLTHLWTLAIEEQFYLVWPIALVVMLTVVRRKWAILALVGGAIVGSSVLMAATWAPVGDPNRSYMGTDTRAGELLVGAFLALALHLRVAGQQPPRSTPRRDVPSGPTATLPPLGCGGMWVALASSLQDHAAFTYRGGIVLAAVASAGMILTLQSQGVARASIRMDAGIVGALGRRSYSIYLWHFPVLVAVSTAQNIGEFAPGRSAVAVVVTLILAEASYRWIESPFRRLGLRGVVAVLAARARRLGGWQRRLAVGLAASPLILAGLALAGVTEPAPQDHGPTSVVVGAKPVGSTGRSTGPGVPPASGHGTTGTRQEPPQTPLDGPLVGKDTVAVGDSLMIDIAPPLRDAVPGVTINAEIGRQPWTGLDVASSYGQFNRPGGNYLLGIGTNGAIDVKMLARFCAERPSARIFLITPRVNRSWEAASIKAIRTVARSHPNVRVVDFHRAASSHPEWFAADGVHVTSTGARAMVRLIRAAAS